MNRDDRSTILVVDDEHGVRQSFNMVLKDEYTVAVLYLATLELCIII